MTTESSLAARGNAVKIGAPCASRTWRLVKQALGSLALCGWLWSPVGETAAAAPSTRPNAPAAEKRSGTTEPKRPGPGGTESSSPGATEGKSGGSESRVVTSDTEIPQVRATSAIMGDLDSGAVLFEQDPDVRLPPASLTKVMTLYLVYEALSKGQLQLDDQLSVSEQAWRTSGSKTFVRIGERVRVEDLILGIAVQSGNDACVVVSEHLAGSEAGFAEAMNRKAKELGMTKTHFANSSGMPDPEHYTTARDMFTMARAIKLHFPKYANYSTQKQYTFNGIQQYNRNRLLWRDPSITGLKTGHTRDAQYCLIATNDLEGQRLAVVILGAASTKLREDESLRLFRYGARMFETVRLYEAGTVIRRLRVWKGDREQVETVVREPLVVTVPRKDRGSLEVGMFYPERLIAPVDAGDQVGTLVVKVGGKELLRQPVWAAGPVASGGFFRSLIDEGKMRMGW